MSALAETPLKHGNGFRHNSRTVAQARRLADAGHRLHEIVGFLGNEGITVNARVVKTWIDDEFAEHRRTQARRRMRLANAAKTKGRLGAGPKRSPEFRLERMRSLHDLGASLSSIAIMMSFDFPDEPVSRSQVTSALFDGRMPRPYARLEREWRAAS